MSKDVALVTYAELPDLVPGDRNLIEPLAELGLRVVAVRWDDAAVDWMQFAAVVIRSCWDYHERPAEFRQWVEHLVAQGVRLYNTPQTVFWNMEKSYLCGLAENGVKVIPSAWAQQGEAADLTALLDAQGWDKVVLKPTIGAGASGIRIVERAQATEHQAGFEALLTKSNVIIQPVLEAVREGEISLIFFDHEFSHAVRKVPDTGSIFVNMEYGGKNALFEASEALIATGKAILETARTLHNDEAYLFARVDGVIVDGEYLLMELELLEPELFLGIAPEASAQRLAQAIAKRALA